MGWISGVKSTVTGWINQVYSVVSGWLNTVYSTVTTWVNNAIETARAVAQDLIAFAIANLTGFIETIRSYLFGLIQDIYPWVMMYFDSARQYALDLINPLLVCLAPIQVLLSIFTPERAQEILTIIDQIKANLLTFIQNPLGYIASLLWDNFVTILCHTLAAALGTTKYELPARPDLGIPGQDIQSGNGGHGVP